jgi:hypothetical protein
METGYEPGGNVLLVDPCRRPQRSLDALERHPCVLLRPLGAHLKHIV